MPAPIDLVGSRFNRLLCVSLDGVRGQKRYWRCQCDCGQSVTASGSNLKSGDIQSCGCLNQELRTAKGRGGTHGMKGTREYRIWASMKCRCANPNHAAFRHYGGRGIRVCARWQQFENFLADMGMCPAGLELDRIDNNGNYEPGNCRWTTRSENQKNTRPRQRRADGTYTGALL